MRVAVSAAAQIGTSTKTAAGIVHYANRRKRLTDTMIAYARTEMIAAPHVVEKTRHVLTARLVVRQPKYVKTRCLPFVAPTAKHASTEAVAQRRMRMRRNVVPTVSELTAPVAQPTQRPVPKQQPMITGVQFVKKDVIQMQIAKKTKFVITENVLNLPLLLAPLMKKHCKAR